LYYVVTVLGFSFREPVTLGCEPHQNFSGFFPTTLCSGSMGPELRISIFPQEARESWIWVQPFPWVSWDLIRSVKQVLVNYFLLKTALLKNRML
jgi:hypothetical protein